MKHISLSGLFFAAVLLDEISEFLLAKETITGDELMAFVHAAKNPAPELPEAEETTEE